MEPQRYKLTVSFPVAVSADPGLDSVAAVADVFGRDT
jgi:hypothetical protein